MEQIITKSKNGNNIEIKIIVPFKGQRSNPYDENYHEEMDNIVALIDEDMSEYGFAQWIDMEYSGKPDQWTDYFFKWWGNQEDFEDICKKLDIRTIYI